VDEWLYFDLTGRGLADARGLSIATVHDRAGALVATAAQEALGRPRRMPT
jgi:acyl-CoA thioesterase